MTRNNTFVEQRGGIAVPMSTEVFAQMNQNDKHNRHKAENFGGKLLAYNRRVDTVTMSPNNTWYYELFSGNVTLRPDKYITINLFSPSLLNVGSTSGYFEMWTVIGKSPSDFWISSPYTDPVQDSSGIIGPLSMSKTVSTTSIGVTLDKEYPYSVKVAIGNTNPPYEDKTLVIADNSPLQFSIEEIGST